MWPNPQETADWVTFTEEILNGKLHFLHGDIFWKGCIIQEYSRFANVMELPFVLWILLSSVYVISGTRFLFIRNSKQIDLLTQKTNLVSLIFVRKSKKKLCAPCKRVIVLFPINTKHSFLYANYEKNIKFSSQLTCKDIL